MKSIFSTITNQLKVAFENAKFPQFWDCLEAEPQCCECDLEMMGNILRELKKVDFKNRPYRVLGEAQGFLYGGMATLADCCRPFKKFNHREKEKDWKEYCEKSNGKPLCEECGTPILKRKGKKINPNERNFDHIHPKHHGGCGRRFNGRWTRFVCNNTKSDDLPE